MFLADDNFSYYIHLEITGDPCNLIGSQQCDCTTTRTQCVPIFIIFHISSIFPSNILIPIFFCLNVPYLVVMNYHWEPSLPNTPGRSKLSEEASPEAEGVGAMATRWRSLWGGGRVERPTSVESQKEE